jgi:hypothetical protein
MAKNPDPHWMEKAFKKNPGALRRKAKKSGLITGGESISSVALRQMARSQNPLTLKQANLAERGEEAR